MRMLVFLATLGFLLSTSPAAAQVAGQQLDVLGSSYEIVQFDVVTFEGDRYELHIPGLLMSETSAGLEHNTLMAHASVSYSGCGSYGEEPNSEVGGFQATVRTLSAYDMTHSFTTVVTPVGDQTTGANTLTYYAAQIVCIQLSESSAAVFFIPGATVHTGDVTRGVHQLAREHAPTTADRQRLEDGLAVLLSHVVINRVR